MRAEDFTKILLNEGFDLYSGVPCSFLKPLINHVIDDPQLDYYPLNNEGEAVAFASGAYLAGKRPVVMFQNSGLGNTVNPVTSLSFPFRIPLLLVSTWRGQPGVKDEPQHEIMGQISTPLLELMRVKTENLPATADALGPAVARAAQGMKETGLPHAFVIPKGAFENQELKTPPRPAQALTGKLFEPSAEAPQAKRFDVIRHVCDTLQDRYPIIGTTGKTGRELFICRDTPNHLYVVGSMGCASSIGLGLAMAWKKQETVVVLDGDGAALMRLEALASVGYYRPKKLIHILLDNNAHDSTGGQQTLSGGVAFDRIAHACGYNSARSLVSLAELDSQLSYALANDGPHFIHVKIKKGSVEDLPRPDVPPHKVKERFMKFLGTAP